MVSCDVTGRITPRTKLKMPIFNLYLPRNIFTYPVTYKVEFWYFKSLCNWDTVSIRTYQNFRDKRLVRAESKCPKISTHKLQDQIFKSRSQIQHNLAKYPEESFQVRPIFIGQTNFCTMKYLKGQKSYLATYMDEFSTKLWSLF